MRKGVYLLPNGLTVCGMFFGFYAIVSATIGDYTKSAWSIMIATVFDGLDGWVARATNSTTKFGIELDSLSDLVAFGIAPAVLIYTWGLNSLGRLGIATAFLFAACGALRLARYNVQMLSEERIYFTGMPIPAAATVIASSVIFYHSFETELPTQQTLLILLMLLMTSFLSILMISTMRFHGIKEIDLKKRRPFWVLVFFLLIIYIIIVHPQTALFSFAMVYLFWGIIENIYISFKKRKRKI